MKRCFCR